MSHDGLHCKCSQEFGGGSQDISGECTGLIQAVDAGMNKLIKFAIQMNWVNWKFCEFSQVNNPESMEKGDCTQFY